MVTHYNIGATREATFSECGKYRFELIVRWAPGPMLAMCGLNPSRATHLQNDPTVARQCERACRLGFGSFLMLNAFAIMATDPKDMKAAEDPYGEWRDADEIASAYRRRGAAVLIAAWGPHATHRGRHDELLRAFAKQSLELHCLVRTKDGYPGHPLYVGYDVQPVRYDYVDH